MLRLKELPWQDLRRGFQQGREQGRISWGDYLLRVSQALWAVIVVRAIDETVHHQLTQHIAAWNVGAVAVSMALFAFSFAPRLRNIANDREAKLSMVLFCAGVALVLALCLPKL
jgi:hypothetical protein